MNMKTEILFIWIVRHHLWQQARIWILKYFLWIVRHDHRWPNTWLTVVSRSGQNFYNLVKWFWQTFNGSTDGNQKYAAFSSFSFLGKFSQAVLGFVKHCSVVCWEVNPKEWLMLWQEMLCNIKLFIKNLAQKNWKEEGFEHLGLRGRNRCWSMPTVKLYVQVSNVKRRERLSGSARSKTRPSEGFAVVADFPGDSGGAYWLQPTSRRLHLRQC